MSGTMPKPQHFGGIISDECAESAEGAGRKECAESAEKAGRKEHAESVGRKECAESSGRKECAACAVKKECAIGAGSEGSRKSAASARDDEESAIGARSDGRAASSVDDGCAESAELEDISSGGAEQRYIILSTRLCSIPAAKWNDDFIKQVQKAAKDDATYQKAVKIDVSTPAFQSTLQR